MIATWIERLTGIYWIRKGSCLECWRNHRNIFSVAHDFRIGFEVELPTEWHEDRGLMIRIALLWPVFYFTLPWRGRLYPDYMQCAGPTYGFMLTNMGDPDWLTLFAYWGQSTGRSVDPRTVWVIHGPWCWGFAVRRDTFLERAFHTNYTYQRRNGEVQRRTVTVVPEEMEWRRRWIPWRRVIRSIDVTFDQEIGEGVDTQKGGTVGCGYEIRDGETPLQCLRRMERERRFDR